MRLKKFFEMFLNESLRDEKINDFMLKNFVHYIKSKGTIGIDHETLFAKSKELNLLTTNDFIKKYPDLKIRQFAKEFFEDPDLYHGQYEEDYYGQDEEDYYDIEDDDYSEDNNDELTQMATIIHSMIEKTGVKNFYVSNKGFNISVQFILSTREKFSKLMKIVGLIKKFKTDVLIQYDVEMDLWETKKADPLLTFDFYYNEKTKGEVKKDDIPY